MNDKYIENTRSPWPLTADTIDKMCLVDQAQTIEKMAIRVKVRTLKPVRNQRVERTAWQFDNVHYVIETRGSGFHSVQKVVNQTNYTITKFI